MIFTKGGEILRNKKGISPLIATVLLIGFTIVLAALVMRWGGTLFKTTTQITGCESQGRLQCTSTAFIFTAGAVTHSGNAGTFVVNNEGNLVVEKVIVQREDTNLAKESFTYPTPISAGSPASISATFTSSVLCPNLRAMYATPVIRYTPTDGSATCEITCTEQQVRVDAAAITCT